MRSEKKTSWKIEQFPQNGESECRRCARHPANGGKCRLENHWAVGCLNWAYMNNGEGSNSRSKAQEKYNIANTRGYC